ncbi:hypothetical protein PIROE2DRAFT_4572 [Piromyces sp. E2]|nr:hypothetical protein PIROE2DRAFT_4572 [Piromyces sp. E2]|eukprot:OUM67892.1 hypothetical protein PIROE2DRAFT_4572 [Piromyces sp. E2]
MQNVSKTIIIISQNLKLEISIDGIYEPKNEIKGKRYYSAGNVDFGCYCLIQMYNSCNNCVDCNVNQMSADICLYNSNRIYEFK